MQRRKGLKGKQMHRLRVLVSAEHYEKLRGFSPERGAGAIVERMIEREVRRQERRPVQSAGSGQREVKVTPYEKAS